MHYLNNMINIDKSSLTEDELDKVLLYCKRRLNLKNPKWTMTKKMGYSTFNIPHNIKMYLDDDNFIRIDRGNLKRLEKEFPFLSFKDKTVSIPIKVNKLFTPRTYQDREVSKIIENGETQGYIFGECACGKTYISADLICRIKEKTLIIVDTEMLMKQWVRVIKECTGITAGVYYGKKKELDKPITIGLVQSLCKDVRKISNKFGMVILDEVHKCPSKTFTDVMSGIKAKYRFGLSGTLRRKDGMHIVIPHIFGKEIGRITSEDVNENKKEIKVKVKIVPTNYKYDNENEKEIKRVKRIKAIQNSYRYRGDEENAQILDRKIAFSYTEYLDQLSKDEDRNNLILAQVKKRAKKGRKIIVFCERLEHCYNLKELFDEDENLKTMLIIGNIGEQYNVTDIYSFAEKQINDNKINIIIGTLKCIEQSMSIPALDVGVITTPSINNELRIKQQVGRLTRYMEGKTDCELIYLWDKNVKNQNNPYSKFVNYYGEENVSIVKRKRRRKLIK